MASSGYGLGKQGTGTDGGWRVHREDGRHSDNICQRMLCCMLYIIYGSIQPGQDFDAISVTKWVREAFWIKKR